MGEITDAIEAIFVLPFDQVDAVKALTKAVEMHEQPILDLNRQQLDRGRDATGKDFGNYKNYNYKKRWKPIDLKKTGALRDKMGLQTDKKQTDIFSQDKKYNLLKRFRGLDPFGVASPFISNVQTIIEPDFVKNYQVQILK